jgi:hypothetical protein
MMDYRKPPPTPPRDQLATLRATVERLKRSEPSDAVALLRQLLIRRIAELDAAEEAPPAPAGRKGPTEKL